MNIIYPVYLFGLVFWMFVFHAGAKRGGAKNPEMTAFLFGMFWPVTVIIFIVALVKSYRGAK